MYHDEEYSWPDLQRAFHDWLGAGRPNCVSINGNKHSSKWLLGEVSVGDGSESPLPPKFCDELGLVEGSTYESAVDLLTEKASQVTPEMLAETKSPDSIDFRWTEDEAVLSFENDGQVVRICLSGKQATELLNDLLIFHDVYISDGLGGTWMVPGVEHVADDGAVFLDSFSLDDDDDWGEGDDEEECDQINMTC